MKVDASEIIGGIVALVLIGSDFFLSLKGHVDSGLQSAVPLIVAFYFGTRSGTAATKQVGNMVANGGGHIHANDEGGAS